MTLLDEYVDKVYNFMQKYSYSRHGTVFTGWVNIEEEMTGDCEDFALTLSYLLANRSVLRQMWWTFTGKHQFWLTRSPVNKTFPRHVVLWVDGLGWCDSTYPRDFRPDVTPHKKRMPFIAPMVYILMLWGAIWKQWKRSY